MGKFFREFNERPQSSSMIVLLLGIAMFAGAVWIVTLAVNGSPLDSMLNLLPAK